MFKNIILSSLTYSSFILSHVIHPDSKEMKKLKTMIRLALRMVGAIHKSTPTSGLKAILGIEDLDIQTDRLGMQTSMRIGQTSPEWDGVLFKANGKINNKRKGHYQQWMNKIDKIIPKALSGPNKPRRPVSIQERFLIKGGFIYTFWVSLSSTSLSCILN